MPQTVGGVISDAETRERLTKPAVKGFFKIAELWDLSEPQQLALLGESISRSTLSSWRSAGPKRTVLSVDQVQRTSLLLGIFEGLQRIFRRAPAEGDRWIGRARSEAPFNGLSPLDYMVQGGIPALVNVRQFVDSATGGPPSREWYPSPPREA
jgi:hypothetical protein